MLQGSTKDESAKRRMRVTERLALRFPVGEEKLRESSSLDESADFNADDPVDSGLCEPSRLIPPTKFEIGDARCPETGEARCPECGIGEAPCPEEGGRGNPSRRRYKARLIHEPCAPTMRSIICAGSLPCSGMPSISNSWSPPRMVPSTSAGPSRSTSRTNVLPLRSKYRSSPTPQALRF